MFRTLYLLIATLSVALCALAQASPVASPSRRSEVHPIPRAAADADLPLYPGAPRALRFPNGVSRVYRDAEWEVFSRKVNLLTCHAESAGRTWLGTALGLKAIDRRAGTVRHYTRLEGLPGDYVEAVATEGDHIWCSVLTTERYQPVSTICRLDRSQDRWVVVRKLSWPESVAALGSPDPPVPPVLAAIPGGICFVPPVRRGAYPVPKLNPVSPALCIYHPREGTWEDVAWPPNTGGGHPDLVLHAAQLDRGAAWLGTSAGLFRYDWRKRAWQLLSPGRPVLALRHHGDTIWAVRLPRPGDAAPTPQMHPWVLARGNPRTGEWSEMPSANPKLFPFAWTMLGTPISLQVRGSTVWIALRSDPSEALPVIVEFDVRSRRWYAPFLPRERQTDLAVVPDAVLLDTPTSGNGLLASVVPNRFPGFVCPEEHLPPAAFASSNLAPYPPTYGGSGEWNSYEGALLHSLPTGAQEQFRPKLSGVLIDPPVLQVFAVGGRLLAQTGEGVFEREPPGAWHRLKLPLAGAPGQEAVLLAAGPNLWVGNAGAVMRCDPRMATLQVVLSPMDPTLRLLGVTGDEVWLTDLEHRRLFRCPFGAEEPQLVAPPLPPELRRFGEGSIWQLGVSGGIVWYTGMSVTGPKQAAVAGWSQAAGRWTAVHTCETTPSSDGFQELDGRVFFAGCHGRSVPVVAYDPRTDSWSPAGPAMPPSDNAQSFLRMIAVTPDRLWCEDQANLTVWELDRHAGKWTAFPCPDPAPTNAEHLGVLAGNEIYLATTVGVRGLEITTHRWEDLPFRSRRGLTLDAPVASGASVWCLGYGARTYVLRLSPATSAWRKWELPEAVPPPRYGPSALRLIPEGPAASLLFNGSAYRVDESSDTAVNLLPSAAGQEPPPQVKALVPAGPDLWLVASTAPPAAGAGAAREQSLLIRYDRESRRATKYLPPDGGTITAMLVEDTTLWIGTTHGYYGFDKATSHWQPLDLPLLPEVDETAFPRGIARDGDDLWFGAPDRTIRWKHPPAHLPPNTTVPGRGSASRHVAGRRSASDLRIECRRRRLDSPP